MLKKLFLLGILAVMVQLFRETAFAVSNQAAPGNPVSPSSTVFQLRDPLLSNLLLPLPPLLLPDLLFPPYDFPSFNSQRLDQELQLYYRYLQRYGRPDVMIVGSSRSLQGVDPTALRESLAAQGYPNAKVYNFGINGATAQVMQLLLTEVLAPEQLPKMLIWGDGSRAFNSGRRDITYNGIVASAGYRHLQAGYHPIPTRIFSTGSIPVANQSKTADLSPEPAIAPDLDRYGFNPLSDRYDPQTYYQRFPVVLGRYDSNYQDFQLWGNQSNATVAIADFAKTYQIPLIFVSLPLTDDYLADPTRSQYEQRFHQHMGELARQRGFTFIDYHQHPNLIQNNFFVDPSHINRYGAAAVAQQLAADAQIPWQILRTP